MCTHICTLTYTRAHISSADIKNVANFIITNSKPTIAVVGPSKNILEYQEFSNLFL